MRSPNDKGDDLQSRPGRPADLRGEEDSEGSPVALLHLPLAVLAPSPSLFTHRSALHGQAHVSRVMVQGAGHLFKIDAGGNLLADLPMGEGAIYHPGGIDYDGTNIWVPVAEYRPDSRAIIYRVDPRTMTATEVFRFADHIGAIVRNTDDRTLHGVSWGSRRFYRWTLDGGGRVTDAGTAPEAAVDVRPVST